MTPELRRAIKYARQSINNVRSYGGVWASVPTDDLALLCDIAEQYAKQDARA